MVLGILHRYVIGQVLRSFVLSLLTLTAVIVLFMVMAEANNQGLAPQAILKLIPYIIPGTLPYTVPVALLFSVSVVYGRMAGDNEVVAVKAAGQSAWTILVPSLIFGGVLSGLLMLISGEVIPRANHAFKMAIFKDAEETFYLVLKREREFNNPRWPFFIGVKDVKDRLLIGPTFKHRAKGAINPYTYDYTVQAEVATVRFDETTGNIAITLRDAVMQGGGQTVGMPGRQTIDYPLPEGGLLGPDKRVQEMTGSEIRKEYALVRHSINTERKNQAIQASLWIASGRIDRVHWPNIRNAIRDDVRWQRKSHELLTESQMRRAMAFSPMMFVLLGAPVGILFARRDFLSAFITCFVPIILLYYPLVLAGINMGKEGLVWPEIVWAGNAVLGILATAFALPPVLKH